MQFGLKYKFSLFSAFGQAQVSTKSPDTITSWVLSGFAVSNVTGFGVADKKPQVYQIYTLKCTFL